MAKKRKNSASSQKFRVDFRRNRNAKTRINDWTQRFQADEFLNDDEKSVADERISGKGELVRKRTVIGTVLDAENASGERGDFTILPDIDFSRCQRGRVLHVNGLYSYVEDQQGRIYTCVTRRILKTLATDQRQVVVVGDQVLFRDANLPERLEGVIERVEPRHGTLSRTSRNRKHIIVTNVDQVLIIQSAAEPYLKPNLIDRFIVTCERSGLKPIICINKIDLVDPVSLLPIVGCYAQMGYPTFLFSVKTGAGVERIHQLLKDRESVVVGQSGVGKSSLLNAVDPGNLNLQTGEVSEENQKGKHTTTIARLLKLSFGGYVIDTPGIRQFMLWDMIPEEVLGFYRDLRPYENLCYFSDCRHLDEKNCAIKNAVALRRLDSRRYESYLALRNGEME